ncbi:MAG: 1-acyl-sn-glycerol-3-phosphate acyltransferase [Nitrospinota bacterium]|nr:1-acyl-sn-glycerol-3-phosphate acyltransferase [Nitrospinota bacterium]
MNSTVTIPFWLLILLCVLAAWAAIGSLLIPSVRWFLRRRVSRVIDELNTRLQLRIQPFKTTKRQVLIDRLLYDPEVLKAVELHSTEHKLSRDEAMAEAENYAREIVPSFNAYAYFRAGYAIARWCARLLYRVRLGYSDETGLSKVDKNAGVVFVMNHRSNMDYILVAYLAATRAALSYAVGEWARIWPLQTLIRTLGAYFIRRNSGNHLYRRVLARYVQMATEGGVVQAVYPEGGLSRDGKIRPIKLGLLSYMVLGFDPDRERDIVFVPVGINYDRVIEDRSLLLKLEPAPVKRSFFFAIKTTLGFILHNFSLMLRRRWYRFGYAGVNFGTPISMKSYMKKHRIDFRKMNDDSRHEAVERLGKELMSEVGKVIPVLPVSLVATVLLEDGVTEMEEGKEFSELELKVAVQRLVEKLENLGGHVYIPRADQEYAITVGLRMLTLRRLVIKEEGMYRANIKEVPLLRFYANSIEHLLSK